MSSLPAQNGYANAINQGARKTWVEGLRSFVREMLGGADEENLVLAADTITPTVAMCTVDTEGGAATDNLANALQTNHPEGRPLRIRAFDPAHVVTIKHNAGGAGLFLMADGVDFVLDSRSEFIEFVRDGNNWQENFRSRANRVARVLDITADRVAVPSDCGRMLTNRGAAGLVKYTLTGLPVGFWFRMHVVAAQNLRAVADAGETIRRGANVSAAAGFIQSNVIGDSVVIQKISATEWQDMGESPGAAYAVT
jgi:hypothetical protein